MKSKTVSVKKEVIYKLALHWGKDHRTIREWFKKENPLLTHPESVKIINAK